MGALPTTRAENALEDRLAHAPLGCDRARQQETLDPGRPHKTRAHRWLPYMTSAQKGEGTYTVETAYKVAICPRGNLLYKQLLLNNRPKVTLERRIWALIYLLYK